MRSVPFYPLLVVILIGLGSYLGCDPSQVEQPVGLVPTTTDAGLANPVSGNTAASRAHIPDRSQNTILIGSFNIQRLGPSKLQDRWVMQKLAEVIRKFDIIALQEITTSDPRTLPALVNQVNASGGSYNYTLSPKVGRKYFEQYAFVFDTARVFSGPEYCYLVQDQQDVLHREPFVGRFRTTTGTDVPFQFTLINMHTDPDEIADELNVLADVYRNVRQFEYPEDDVLLLGDLNAAPDKLLGLNRIPDFVPLIRGVPTNIRRSKMLDNILADQLTTAEFTGRSGTIDLENMFRIEFVDAQRISDHLPIWAEFTINERSGSVATVAGRNPTTAVR